MVKIAERMKVVDADTHIIEPYDLWTSRLGHKYDMVPHVATVGPEAARNRHVAMTVPGDDVWVMGAESVEEVATLPVGMYGMAGWSEPLPAHPRNISEVDPAAYDAAARLKKMDEYGIHAQILYPNVGGFGAGGFLKLPDPNLKRDCVRAYNDFMHDWCSEDPKRLIALAATPFWDLDFALEEIKRSAKLGHKGIMFTWSPEIYGEPHLADPHWDPLWDLVTALDLPVNFHVGSGVFKPPSGKFYEGNGFSANFARLNVEGSLTNASTVLEIINSGITQRFPTIKFVSVESGVGWIPFVLENLAWLWGTTGAFDERPEFRETSPVEIFKRNVFGTFWFESETLKSAVDFLGPDNFMFSTDFPHPTSVAPGPNTLAKNPIDHLEERFGDLGLAEEVVRKVVCDNAVKLYHLE